MKRILASTAIVALTATPVMAESHSNVAGEMDGSTSVETTNGDTSMQVQGDASMNVEETTDGSNSAASGEMDASASADMSNDDMSMQAQGDASLKAEGMTIHASDLIGKPVYIRTEAAADADIAKSVGAVPDGWEHAGDVSDVILTKAGNIDKVVLGAGGFLGIGEKSVSASIEELKFVAKSGQEDSEDYFVVFTGDRAALEARDAMNPQAVLEEGFSFFTESSQGMGEADMSGDDAGRPSEMNLDMDLVNLTDEERDELTAAQLEGQTVYDANGKDIGEISHLVLTGNGKIAEVVIDVGGFLGIGEKPVAVAYGDVTLKRNSKQADGGLYVTTTHTEEDFDSMEEWDG